MKYRLSKFPLIRSLLLYFILLLSEKLYFTAKNFNIHIISLGLTYVNVCKVVFRTYSNIYGKASLQKSQESFIEKELWHRFYNRKGLQNVNIYLRSKLNSKIFHYLLVSRINKKACWFNSFMTEASIIKKPVQSIDLLWKWVD